MNPFELIQPFFAARLKTLEYFSDIAVGAPRLFKEGDKVHTPKTIAESINKTLTGLVKVNGKAGAAVKIFQPGFSVPKNNLPGPQGNITLPIRIETHPTINFSASGTNKYASAIGIEVLRAGHSFRIEGVCGSLFADGDCFEPYFSDESQLMTVDILLQCKCALTPIACVVKPSCTVADGTVTLTSNTADAEIRYSTDLSFPDSNATLYIEPVAIASGTELFFAAYKAGLAGSEIGYVKIP